MFVVIQLIEIGPSILAGYVYSLKHLAGDGNKELEASAHKSTKVRYSDTDISPKNPTA